MLCNIVLLDGGNRVLAGRAVFVLVAVGSGIVLGTKAGVAAWNVALMRERLR